MKLRNKKTGEIWDIGKILTNDYPSYDRLEQINEDWEDYEEPKFYINFNGEIKELETIGWDWFGGTKEIGNIFEGRKEAQETVEKLKAWKRLKDRGFKFNEWYKPDGCESFIVIETNVTNDDIYKQGVDKDLDLLFGEKTDV